MRNFKFRAWYEVSKKMYYNVYKKPLYKGKKFIGFTWISYLKNNPLGIILDIKYTDIMYYTQLKDQYNKGIYEGDILQYGRYIGYVLYSQHNGGFILLNNSKAIDFNYKISKCCKIIGNIFDNPEKLA